MSDSTNQPQTERPQEKQETKTGPKKTLLGDLHGLNGDLSQALNAWDKLTVQMADKVSPEEEQLQEVKKLLGELKSKLNEFTE